VFPNFSTSFHLHLIALRGKEEDARIKLLSLLFSTAKKNALIDIVSPFLFSGEGKANLASAHAPLILHLLEALREKRR